MELRANVWKLLEGIGFSVIYLVHFDKARGNVAKVVSQ